MSALRWAAMLRSLGYRVRLGEEVSGRPELVIALHAHKSAAAVAAARAELGAVPIVVALTGTDVYGDLETASACLAAADRLLVLQPRAIAALPERYRDKARVVWQSSSPPRTPPPPASDAFEVCVIGHLREVKDPLRAALASRELPASSRIRIVQLGAALDPALGDRARAEAAVNPRYRWLGERSRRDTLRILASSRLLCHSSRLEGGANAISEAIVCGVPVLSSRIDGSIGLLGEGYPGYFAPGDSAELCALLQRAENDPGFLAELTRGVRAIAPRFTPAAERASWQALLAELGL